MSSLILQLDIADLLRREKPENTNFNAHESTLNIPKPTSEVIADTKLEEVTGSGHNEVVGDSDSWGFSSKRKAKGRGKGRK